MEAQGSSGWQMAAKQSGDAVAAAAADPHGSAACKTQEPEHRPRHIQHTNGHTGLAGDQQQHQQQQE